MGWPARCAISVCHGGRQACDEVPGFMHPCKHGGRGDERARVQALLDSRRFVCHVVTSQAVDLTGFLTILDALITSGKSPDACSGRRACT